MSYEFNNKKIHACMFSSGIVSVGGPKNEKEFCSYIICLTAAVWCNGGADPALGGEKCFKKPWQALVLYMIVNWRGIKINMGPYIHTNLFNQAILGIHNTCADTKWNTIFNIQFLQRFLKDLDENKSCLRDLYRRCKKN